MTHLALPQMVERRRGAVITIASGASAKPTPQMTVYSATKVSWWRHPCHDLCFVFRDVRDVNLARGCCRTIWTTSCEVWVTSIATAASPSSVSCLSTSPRAWRHTAPRCPTPAWSSRQRVRTSGTPWRRWGGRAERRGICPTRFRLAIFLFSPDQSRLLFFFCLFRTIPWALILRLMAIIIPSHLLKSIEDNFATITS